MPLLAVVLLVALLAPAPADAWGFDAHRLIADRMIALLPAEIRPLFEKRRTEIVARAVDPDLWRNIFPEEAPNHFLDFDHYGAVPFSELPREYDRAVERWGREVVHEQGLLPWRTAEIFGKLRRDFAGLTRDNAAAYLPDNIAYYAAVIAHYVSDGHVPLHAVVNYDGQRTNQAGLHSRWESDLFDRTRSRLTIAPSMPTAVTDPRTFVFEILLESNQLAAAVLDADRQASAGLEFYDDVYFERLAARQQRVLEQRLNASITATAALIAGAWEAAGRPPLPPDRPRSLRPVPRPRK